VTSLLQVGTGFHQELSGRDNVFLNASLLRMNKRETQARFDEIVEFAGVERFIDTPVKHYSTGMRSRLAFAVAACLDPEILLLDEVLSVGDEEFRAKSFAKIRQLATSGRTVVFVSHALGQIKGICDRVILLERGNLEAEGNPDAVVTEYLDRLTQGEEQQAENDLLIAPDTERVGTADAQVVRVRLTDLEGRALGAVQFGRPFQVRITVHAKRRIKQGLCFEVGVAPAGGERFATAQSSDEGAPGPILDEGFHEVAVTVDTVLMPGDYSLDVGILRAQNGTVEDMIYDVLRFPAANGVKGEDRWPWPQSARGYTRLPAAWDEPTRVEAPPERPDG
jgi:ABC-type sugar transport system ATPase subunit